MDDTAIALARHEEQIKTLFGRLSTLETITNNINDLRIISEKTNAKVDRICDSIETLGKRSDETDARIDALEKVPATRWNDIAKQALSLLVAAVMGFLLKNLIP